MTTIWKALIKIQWFIHSLPTKTDRRHRDRKAVKLLVKEIIELKSRFKVLEECKKALQKESKTSQGGITVSRMTVFRQSAANLCFVDSCVLINILEFAASFENVSLILQACQEWNEIINKNKLTSESIWHRIAHGQYNPHEFEELERINPWSTVVISLCGRQYLRLKQGLNGRCFKGKWVGQYKDCFGCSMADCCLTNSCFG